MTVHCRGDCTRQCTPGDDCVVDGIFLPTPFTGFRGVRAGLIADTYLECMHIVRQKKSYDELGQARLLRTRARTHSRRRQI